MSLLSWLFPSKPKAAVRNASPAAQAGAEPAAHERTQRREHLYLAVRDAMVRSAVLSSGYKFKVLSLDAEGRQFLVMIDIAPGYGADTARQGQMEELLVRTAKTRFHVEVSAVYWRLNPALTGPDRPLVVTPAVAMAPEPAPAAAQAAAAAVATPAPAPLAPPAAEPASEDEADFEPIAPDEVEAFKQALRKAAPAPAPVAPPRVQAGRREGSAAADGFVDTLIVDEEERASRLGATQYGELR
ncbi:hypothetical protein [Comamonas sp. NLF-1-9]|uniref:hypothetical protein n=1 Tax=Comamonas sp. NLF-1-9 TaxID=2853163 RepID=UPI001C47386A|nr:hypothetical protein [Comamonas sp. NLF-1-9]QXL83770.1 hypothetical protein KUD94_11025 [Comamonas sp. NLF-1-9]